MDSKQHLFRLKPEANFFDAKSYMLKTVFAVFTAYIIAKQWTFVSGDMISVLFGLMLTLEPVTLTGFKKGWEQIYATIIGAIVTALIVGLFGINAFTIAISVALTILVCVRIDWRYISPIAIFTSIYMTQYVQHDAQGEVSMLNTFALRMLALGTGVLVAWFYNFIFAMFAYRRMKKKRLAFLLISTKEHLEPLLEEQINYQYVVDEKKGMSTTFNDIEWLYGLLEDMKLDNKILSVVGIRRHMHLESYQRLVMDIKEINHMTYDLLFALEKQELTSVEKGKLKEIHHHLQLLCDYFATKEGTMDTDMKADYLENDTRISMNINEMLRHISYMDEGLRQMK